MCPISSVYCLLYYELEMRVRSCSDWWIFRSTTRLVWVGIEYGPASELNVPSVTSAASCATVRPSHILTGNIDARVYGKHGGVECGIRCDLGTSDFFRGNAGCCASCGLLAGGGMGLERRRIVTPRTPQREAAPTSPWKARWGLLDGVVGPAAPESSSDERGHSRLRNLGRMWW